MFRNIIGRIAAVDYGTRRIGLALCDPGQRIASPAGQLDAAGRPAPDADQVARWLREHQAAAALVGHPINMDGSAGPQARLAEAFAARLVQATDCPVLLWDERLSSFQADQWLAERELTRGQRRRRRDALAAVAILQSYLDARGRDAAPDLAPGPNPATEEPNPS